MPMILQLSARPWKRSGRELEKQKAKEAEKAAAAEERKAQKVQEQAVKQVSSVLGQIGREASRQIIRGIFGALKK